MKNQIKSIQGVRGISIMCIVFSHYAYFKNANGENIFGWGGTFGVSVFLMISGFLALYGATDNSETSFKENFNRVKKKILKWYPLHFITLLISIPLSIVAIVRKPIVHIGCLIINALLLQSWVPIQKCYFSYNFVSWYLSLTTFLVIVTPYCVKKLRKMNLKQVKLTVVACLLIQLVMFFLFSGKSFSHWIIYICPLTRLIEFILGGCIQILLSKNAKLGVKKGIHILFIFYMIVAICLYQFVISDAFLVVVWTIPAILLLVIAIKKHVKLLESKILVFLGDISFELFLIHQLVLRYFLKVCEMLKIGTGIGVYILALVLSVCLAYFFNISTKKIKCKNL